MNDYCNGIAYATGYFTNGTKEKYLVVRNLDKWYIENIAKETSYSAYQSTYNVERDGANQWVLKARDIHFLPELEGIKNKSDFCRAYIEIHGIIDINLAKNRKGIPVKRLRLRIYGKEHMLNFINNILPAKEKKIQYIKNVVDKKYSGETCALYYQSKKEIEEILKWLDGCPKNDNIWDKWESMIKASEK